MPKEVKTTKAKVTKTKAIKKTETPVEVTPNKVFAVIEIAGIQLIVEPDGKYEIGKIEGKKGDKVVVDKVLLTCVNGEAKIGTPYVKGSVVECEIDSQKKGKKIEVFKYKAKARYRKSMGSRPFVTRIAVKNIK
jgi:large subunit ribosomal protein L21